MKFLDIAEETRSLDDLTTPLMRVPLVVGVIALLAAVGVAAVTDHGWHRLSESYLVAFAFFLTIALGALFFVLLQFVTRAGWSVVVRRIAEALALNLLPLALLFVPLLFGLHHLYHWTHADAVASDPILQHKAGYLNTTFFIIRWAVYFVIWAWLARTFWKRSVSQDSSSEPQVTRFLEKLSAPGLLLFALTVNFAAFDLLMSLDPHWFSTIFGVYIFAGGVVGFFALLPLLTMHLQYWGRLERTITIEHYHDIGKLLFAFVVFWAYIAFSQFMLIWYGNLPEETHWYLVRQTDDWVWWSLLLLFGHFFIPFLALLPRFFKRRRGGLLVPGLWLLFMHWVDMYYLVMPVFSPGEVPLHVLDLLTMVGLGGLFLGLTALWLKKVSLVPEGDPRLAESLAFENA